MHDVVIPNLSKIEMMDFLFLIFKNILKLQAIIFTKLDVPFYKKSRNQKNHFDITINTSQTVF